MNKIIRFSQMRRVKIVKTVVINQHFSYTIYETFSYKKNRGISDGLKLLYSDYHYNYFLNTYNNGQDIEVTIV